MSKSIKGTQTEKNLLTSFAGESQARMRYTYLQAWQRKRVNEQISAILPKRPIRRKNMQSVCLSF